MGERTVLGREIEIIGQTPKHLELKMLEYRQLPEDPDSPERLCASGLTRGLTGIELVATTFFQINGREMQGCPALLLEDPPGCLHLWHTHPQSEHFHILEGVLTVCLEEGESVYSSFNPDFSIAPGVRHQIRVGVDGCKYHWALGG